MDETFSAQDSEHKALVVDAIKRVSDRFKKVIVITHDDSLIGSFPQLISVSRNEERLSIEIS
jgi:DNA repair exonuclease SbcCD ATPase subunit